MRICIVTPAPPRSRKGNRVSALRWARMLRSLGHQVAVDEEFRSQRCDLLVALHALRSFPSIDRYRNLRPAAPLIVVMTGTDLYRDIKRSPAARNALAMASRLVVLQSAGLKELPPRFRYKAHVVVQSAERPKRRAIPRKDIWEACVVGHLRSVKDPFRAAMAARRLPADSRIRIMHAGAALSPAMLRRAQAESLRNPRYTWLGDLPRAKTLSLLARSRLLILSSKMEGGANVVSEAIACGVPIVSSRIDGSIGLLGSDYPGYFPVGDTRALASLLTRAETDAHFYRKLKAHCARLRPLIKPAHERQCWRKLLNDVMSPGSMTK